MTTAGQALHLGARAEIRIAQRVLLIDGDPAPLGPKAFDVLCSLIERHDRVVTKDELLDLAWPGLVVEENNLAQQVSVLRRLLGAGAIATIPGRGYRLTLEVQRRLPDGSAVPAHPTTPAAATAPSPSRRTNVPAAFEPAIGREADVERIVASLRAHPLVSIIGPGGIGKTRLAQEVARALVAQGEFEGVWWVDLAPVASGEALGRAVASAAGLQLEEGSAGERIAAALHGSHVALVLDNCEHLADEAAQLVHVLLERVPGVRLLATSQVPLRVAGEHVYRVDPLEMPSASSNLEDARRFAAVELLERRARASDRRFALEAAALPQAIELCSRLDGNPLAIEMVARRLPALGFDAILSHLGQRLSWMRGAQDAPKRQQTLEDALAWSHALLTPEEQSAFRRLAVFSASFSLEAAVRLAGQDDWSEWTAVDALSALVDKSLVQAEGGGSPRYRLLETARMFARQRLAESDEEAAVVRRHGEAMAAIADRLMRDYWSHDYDEWFAQALLEYPDLQAAFERGVAGAHAPVAGPIGDCLNRIEFAMGVSSAIRARKKAAHALLPHASGRAAAKLWNCLSGWRLIRIDEVPFLAVEESRVAAWRAIDDRFELYAALGALATEHSSLDHRAEALRAVAEAEAIEDPAWPVRYRASLLQYLHSVYIYLADLPRAREVIERYLGLLGGNGSRHNTGYAMSLLAEVDIMQGRLDDAIERSRDACETLRAFGQHGNRGVALRTLGAALILKGDVESARTTAREALALLVRAGHGHKMIAQAAFHAARKGRCTEAAWLLGHREGRTERATTFDHPIVSTATEAIARALSPDAVDAAWQKGRALSGEQAEVLMTEVLQPESS
jgi:predicted ATPase/DNA-binding winged helix-turn-helix (wHTH) protein